MKQRDSYLQQRNREIGSVLAAARERQHRSVTECALLLATTRRRYRAIERGEAALTVAELGLLVPYLQVPADLVLPNLLVRPASQEVTVHAVPGDIVRVVIQGQDPD